MGLAMAPTGLKHIKDNMETIPSLSDIKRAHQRIQQYIFRTPVLTSNSIDEVVGAKVLFKCENFQKVGSFKMRGASNMIFGFRPEERINGFATHSSGNHAQAVALASKLGGSKAYVVMPKDATKVKIEAVKEYGAEIIFCEPNINNLDSFNLVDIETILKNSDLIIFLVKHKEFLEIDLNQIQYLDFVGIKN